MITWINYAIYLVISFVNIGMYYLLLTSKKIDNSTIGIAVCVLIGLQPFVAMLINELIVHNEMYKHERQMIEFELDNEKQYHENIMEQGDSLAKIRHDIADQVFVIKNIAQNEPERAYTMMQDLEEKITQELKYVIHAE